MVKTITIEGGKELKLAANAATPFRYKQLFGQDLLRLFQQTQEGEESLLADVCTQLAFIMNRQAEGVNMNTISMDEFFAWLEDYEPMSFIMAAQDIIDTYLSSTMTTIESKKK